MSRRSASGVAEPDARPVRNQIGHRHAIRAPEDVGGGAPPARPARGWFVGEGPQVRGRAIWLMLAFAALGATLLTHLVIVQVVEHATLSAAAARDHEMSFVLPAHRGEILDSSGRVVVSTEATYSVYVDPALITASHREDDAAQIAKVLGLNQAQVATILAESTQYAYLASDVSQSVKDQMANLVVDAQPVNGIIIQEQDQPVYEASAVPGESFAANLLGFVNASGEGQYGVEGYYNGLLSGTAGKASEIKDSQGNAIYLSEAQKVAPSNGDNLELGLNSQVQYWAEQAIAQAVTADSAANGEILIMDTKTGAIEAWADYPSYSANNYGGTPIGDFRDLSVDGLFQPGSLMKTVTFAGALENGAITPGYTFDERPTTIDGVTIQDWDGVAHGEITMQKVLDDSLNNGAIKALDLEGENPFYANMLAFGIGAPTGVDLAGEVNQPMAPQSQLSALDYAEMSFGQSVVVTPVEMLAAINAVGNGGVWVQPHAVDSIINTTTGVSTAVTPVTRRVIPAATAQTLTTMLTGVVDDTGGEGFEARIPGFAGEVALKTGTAQEPTNGTYQGALDDSVVGYLPASNPQFTMLVDINDAHVPASDNYGSILAAPVFKQMAEQIIDLDRIAP